MLNLWVVGEGGRVGKMVIGKYGFHDRVINGLGTKHCLNVHILISCLLWFVSADNFTAVFHSLDVWHKAKSIRKWQRYSAVYLLGQQEVF